jgi:putative membrane protein
MRLCPCLIVLLFSLAGLTGCNQRNRVEAAVSSDADTVSEPEFMIQAAEDHLAHLEMARVAKMHSKNGPVKSYAEMILKDHQQGLQDLTRLMAEKDIQPPNTFSGETKQDIDRMASLSGADFDREFINMMVSTHEKTLELFRSVSLTAHDTDVQDYVDAMIPKLDKHLKEAHELQSKLFSGRADP